MIAFKELYWLGLLNLSDACVEVKLWPVATDVCALYTSVLSLVISCEAVCMCESSDQWLKQCL